MMTNIRYVDSFIPLFKVSRTFMQLYQLKLKILRLYWRLAYNVLSLVLIFLLI